MLILITWLLDLWLGEPPVRLHPVIWMGNCRFCCCLPKRTNFKFFIFNLFATAVLLKPLKNKIKEQRCFHN